MQTSLPLTRDLVLIGGGHAHALVLLKWAMKPLAGARLTLTALSQLERTGGRYALVTLCIGVGQGMAAVIERI